MNQRVNAQFHRAGVQDDFGFVNRVMDKRNRRQPADGPDAPVMPCSALMIPAPDSYSEPDSEPNYPFPPNVVNARDVRSLGHGKLAVANFGMTHGRRTEILAALCDGAKGEANQDWLTCIQHSGTLNGLSQHYALLSEYLYWLSPRGNGLESHRTWEALYLGCVPVLERSEITAALFEDGDLPVLLVDDLTTLTKEVLLANLPRFERIDRDFARKKLTLDHWKEKIVGKQREWRQLWRSTATTNMTMVELDEREHHRCWGATQTFTENW